MSREKIKNFSLALLAPPAPLLARQAGIVKTAEMGEICHDGLFSGRTGGSEEYLVSRSTSIGHSLGSACLKPNGKIGSFSVRYSPGFSGQDQGVRNTEAVILVARVVASTIV